MNMKQGASALAAVAAIVLLAGPSRANAHCDTLDGPVVSEARAALAAGDVTPVLKWVGAEREADLRAAFQHTMAVRALSPEARSLADRFFFETLVRVHREGEGAPYTGLKPAGTEVDPGIAGSDRAIESGDVAPLVGMVTARAEQGLRERFARVAAAKRQAGDSVEKGRAYVAAYVDFMHYAERLLQTAGSDSAAHGAHSAHAPAAPPAVPAAPASPAGHVH